MAPQDFDLCLCAPLANMAHEWGIEGCEAVETQTISDVFREDGRYTKAEEDVIWRREERRLRDLDDGIIWDDDH